LASSSLARFLIRATPVITTASVPDGPNRPLMPEIQEAAPHAVYVPRKGEVNAWDNALFVKTVRETGKKTLIMAGVWTNVCVMFPALDAKADGFKVYVAIDASGDPTKWHREQHSPVSRRPASFLRALTPSFARCIALGTGQTPRELAKRAINCTGSCIAITDVTIEGRDMTRHSEPQSGVAAARSPRNRT
jgi:hypothetical protein